MNIMRDVSVNEIKEALLNEYKRKFLLYKLTDDTMKKKYSMDFNEFEKKQIVKSKDFSWDVESDSMEWEHAMEGIHSMKEKIDKIKSE
jgi:hypothetical protein